MIWSLVSQASSQKAISASRALRPKVRSADRNTPLASCCVIVLPPCDDPLDQRLCQAARAMPRGRSEEHTSELQSLMRISYAVFCLKKKIQQTHKHNKDMY